MRISARKIYVSTERMIYKRNSLNANERKRSSRRMALIGLRFVPSVTVFHN